MTKIFLDARQIQHPVPLEKAIEALKSLNEGNYFYMLHRKEPIPLLALAGEHNLNFISKEIDGKWHILISSNRSINLEDYIEDFDV